MMLAEFLLARLAEDQEVAQSVPGGAWEADLSPLADPSVGSKDRWIAECLSPEDAQHIARFNGTRMVRDCQSKRRIVALADQNWRPDAERLEGSGDYSDYDHTLRLMAEVYADHPDYREEWRP